MMMMIIHLSHFTRLLSSSIRDVRSWTTPQYRCWSTDQHASINHYQTLQIQSDATSKEIKVAFYTLSKKHHPDVNPTDSNAAKRFALISNAYDILIDPIKRREYDQLIYRHGSSFDPSVSSHRPSSTFYTGDFTHSRNAYGEPKFRRYRGPHPTDHYDRFDGDEFAHARDEDTTDTSKLVRITAYLIWFSLSVVGFFTSNVVLQMNFQQPTEECQVKTYKVRRRTS
jgi:DnaJ-class molecular chaperone